MTAPRALMGGVLKILILSEKLAVIWETTVSDSCGYRWQILHISSGLGGRITMCGKFAVEFSKLARGIWKTLPWKTVAPSHTSDQGKQW